MIAPSESVDRMVLFLLVNLLLHTGSDASYRPPVRKNADSKKYLTAHRQYISWLPNSKTFLSYFLSLFLQR